MRLDPKVDYRKGAYGMLPPEKCAAFAALYRGIVARTGSSANAAKRLRMSSSLLTDIERGRLSQHTAARILGVWRQVKHLPVVK